MTDARGSLWRKWDLHVHTPASFHWKGARFSNMSPAQSDEACKAIIDKVNASDVAVFAVVDYWTFDGYCRIRDYESRSGYKLAKTLLPGMEVRVEAPTEYRLNAQIIFSDRATQQELRDFKSNLRVLFPTGNHRPLSDEALITLTHELGEDKLKQLGATEALLKDDAGRLVLGAKAALVTRQSLHEAIAPLRRSGKAVVVQPYDTSGGVEKLDWKTQPVLDGVFLHFADMFETRDQDSVDLFHGAVTPKNEKFIQNFLKAIGGKPKPAVCGSDAHAVADYGLFPGGRACWIKADANFLGLLQTINEPGARTFIGDEPLHLKEVRRRPMRYLSSVEVRKIPGATEPDAWFDALIPLNHELVAIIGNKGSGKSALADIVGLLGASHNERHFSFLRDAKFRNPKDNKARSFRATATWESQETTTRTLDSRTGPGEVERVTYLPQSRLEEICNELDAGVGSAFDCELKAVIFSHIPVDKRLGAKSIDELLSIRKGPLDDRIQQLRVQLSPLNEKIATLEQALTPEYRANLQRRIEAKEKELAAHDALRPVVVEPPEKNPETKAAAEKLMADIEESRQRAAALDDALEKSRRTLDELQRLTERARQVRTRLENLQRQFQTFTNAVAEDLAALEIPFDAVVDVKVSFHAIDEKLAALVARSAELEHELDASRPDSFASRRAAESVTFAALEAKLEGPAKEYERYRTEREAWQAARATLVGNAQLAGSLEFEKARLAALEVVPERLAALKQKRLELSLHVYDAITAIAQLYEDVYDAVQRFVQEQQGVLREFPLNFSVAIRESGLEDALFAHLNRAATGSFAGLEDGARMLQGILARHDLGSAAGVTALLQELDDHLHRDHRVEPKPVTTLHAQLRKNHKPESVYDVIFGLTYLLPTYSLRLGSKELSQLSPGERGAVLLAFYLLIDRSDTPLVIDQPEENLDNETVYRLLGSCLRVAKARRQVVMVTHNPNLAVACDAEQVIHARHVSDGGNRIEYSSGAIENPAINAALLNVLEGTRPAFQNRESKYFD
ncbi:TrlF family AAA-like ATPase [Anaeromyxobacter sp. SG66]|uniref:TrlF family AAA-like ATPase n=1 Tax=Anaeromyxobacter sp. SG66 TaxID=2925410 RepID=UPI001F55F810|nr:hypothetical protein [Anaeromyxobacter sp. SG66]